MRNCNECIFCANLRNKNNFIFNKQVTKEEYEEFKKNLKLDTKEGIEKAKKQYEEFMQTQPRKYLEVTQCENSMGDYLKSCKNAKICFDGYNLEDVSYSTHVYNAKDCMDWDFVANKAELCYEMVSSAHNLFNCKFCMNCWNGNQDLTYCDLCLGSKKCFGCVGLRNGKYCILNKEYSEEEYEALVPKIIEHMKRTGEWGEFFHASMSPFAYNESVAHEYTPLTKEQALAKNLQWHDEDKKDYQPQTYQVPNSIEEVKDEILNEVLACEECGKNYKIIKQELFFYRQNKLSIPQKCFNCRHKSRMDSRNPRILFDDKCAKCSTPIKTTYDPKRGLPIYCEKCYLEHVD